MRCGAALTVRPGHVEPWVPERSAEAMSLRCDACETVHASAAAPRALAQPDQPDQPERALDARQPVVAEWGGLWWRAELIEKLGDAPERWRVRYLGWSDEHAQALGRDRVAELFGGGAPIKRWKWLLVAVGLAVLGATGVLLANKGKLVKSQATTVEATTPLTVGQPIEIERDGTWVAGEVLEVRDDGTVLVRYLDRGPISEGGGDEPVARARLRVP